MQSTTRKAAASVLFCSVAMALAAQAVAADAPGVGNKNVNALTQPIYANPVRILICVNGGLKHVNTPDSYLRERCAKRAASVLSVA